MAIFGSLEQLRRDRHSLRRRRFITVSLAGIVCFFGWRWWRFRPQPISQRNSPFVTSNKEFFSVSIKAGFRPERAIDQWRLVVGGLDSTSLSWSYEEILSMEKRRVYRTLMCIGSGVGSTGIGNAEWTVTPLGPLLQSVLTGGRDDRLRVIFYGMDGFYSSVPLEVALDQDSFLAFEMNGASLPIRHGYPLRVLLPGKYGMKQPRWLERITVTDRNELGYWEKRGWSDDCEVKMTARIDSAKELAKRNWLVKGVAYCGRSAVGCVEVSDDQGVTWSLARLTREALRNAWCTWEFEWHPRVRGECVLTVRVSGSQGEQQIQRYSGSFPSGSTGLHRVIVRV